MKLVLLLGFLAGAAYAAAPPPKQTYTTKYDNVNIDEVLNNNRLYKNYFDCLMGKGRCTPDGKELKDLLPDALATACVKCSQKQKDSTDKVLKFLLAKKPRDYDQLEKLYDPQGVYRKKYNAEAKKHGINL